MTSLIMSILGKIMRQKANISFFPKINLVTFKTNLQDLFLGFGSQDNIQIKYI